MINFLQELIKSNRMYRLALLITCLNISGVFSGITGDEFYIGLYMGLILFFVVLPVLDRPFRRYLLAMRQRYYERKELEAARKKRRRQRALAKLPPSEWNGDIKAWLMSQTVPYLTQLPVFGDYWQDSLFHWRNPYLLGFKRTLDQVDKAYRTKLYQVDLDRNHATFYFVTRKLRQAQAKNLAERAVRQYCGTMPAGVMIKMRGRSGEVLLPRELVIDRNLI